MKLASEGKDLELNEHGAERLGRCRRWEAQLQTRKTIEKRSSLLAGEQVPSPDVLSPEGVSSAKTELQG